MEALEERLRYVFRDRALLDEALSHSSYANEHRQGAASNERLEFLGDSVLGFVSAEHLFLSFPDQPEGDLTRLRASLVCERSLYEAARELDLGRYLKLGRGEEAGGGRERPSILADAMEAVIAAVYLDGGMESARELIHRVLLDCGRGDGDRKDYKTTLQERVQSRGGQTLSYHMLSESGPDHRKTFVFEVRLNGRSVGRGRGRSKKEAEQDAARDALSRAEDGA